MAEQKTITETPKELESVITAILEADAKAREITDAAEASKARTDSIIAEKTTGIQKKYQELAQREIEALRASAEKEAQTQLRAEEERQAEKLAQLEARFAAGKDRWTEEIFRQIIG